MNKQKAITNIVFIIVTTTLGTFIFSYLVFVTLKNKLPTSILTLWNQWDTLYYLEIAENGYTNTGPGQLRIAFFPFYPLLIRLFALVLKNYMLSALVVSNLAYSFAAFYLYRLVLLDYPEETALRTVFYLSIFPTAYFLHAGYTESLYLALTISSFYYARKDKWFLSSLIGMLASATRIIGIALLPVLILEYLFQKDFQIKNVKKDISCLCLIPLGFVSYLIINYVTFDHPFKFLEVQKENWGRTLAFPSTGLAGALATLYYKKDITAPGEVTCGILGLIFVIYSLMRFRISYGIYMLITWLIITSSAWYSIPRFTLSMFPLFISLSFLGRRKEVNDLITFIFLLFYSLFLIRFIFGQWAF